MEIISNPYKNFVAIMLNGSIKVCSGIDIADALGTPIGIDYYLENTNEITVGERWWGNGQVLDVTGEYVVDTCTTPYTYIITDVKPLSGEYKNIIGIRLNSKDEIVESIKRYTNNLIT